MGRLVDALSVVLLLGSAFAFGAGVDALAERRDLTALYWLVVGALTLKAAVDVVRPRSVSR
ncbi:MAG: hypothetical protein R3B13_33230 [Polyangiaceae bacterium]